MDTIIIKYFQPRCHINKTQCTVLLPHYCNAGSNTQKRAACATAFLLMAASFFTFIFNLVTTAVMSSHVRPPWMAAHLSLDTCNKRATPCSTSSGYSATVSTASCGRQCFSMYSPETTLLLSQPEAEATFGGNVKTCLSLKYSRVHQASLFSHAEAASQAACCSVSKYRASCNLCRDQAAASVGRLPSMQVEELF